ncbi:hypothetical protein JAO71_01935 [Olleya sp. YSTF-M6]|uniref:Uncharacterized protein n=1 Tax=Olleya sediminilitoris TaxID=2795739 RepID=A0ABS1WHL0_9FLAO|nr:MULTISPECIES: DUF6168 family protein [Olleya]MBL7558548.1 hypothetical protein [Olleya sediminilitoris]
MNKRIVFVISLMLVVLAISFGIHKYVTNDQVLPYSLNKLYLFHGIAALIVYSSIEGIYSVMPNQLGYAYLTMMLIKIGMFILIFKATVFSATNLTLEHRLGLVIPFFLFLIIETACIAKLLKSE